MKLKDITFEEHEAFAQDFIKQAQSQMDDIRKQREGSLKKLKEALIRREALAAAGLDLTMVEYTIKAHESAVETLEKDIAVTETELKAYQTYQDKLAGKA